MSLVSQEAGSFSSETQPILYLEPKVFSLGHPNPNILVSLIYDWKVFWNHCCRSWGSSFTSAPLSMSTVQSEHGEHSQAGRAQSLLQKANHCLSMILANSQVLWPTPISPSWDYQSTFLLGVTPSDTNSPHFSFQRNLSAEHWLPHEILVHV